MGLQLLRTSTRKYSSRNKSNQRGKPLGEATSEATDLFYNRLSFIHRSTEGKIYYVLCMYT